MRIHAVQTGLVAIKTCQCYGKGRGTMRLVNTLLDQTWANPLPIYSWAIKHPEGIILIDTGETARSMEPGYFPWWNPYFHLSLRPNVQPEDEVSVRLRTLGIEPDEVRWVILTHLHTDHSGGLHHFPNAEIIISRREYELTNGFRGQLRGYLTHRWPGWLAPRLVEYEPKPIGPFAESLTLTKAGDVCLVPTEGHTRGHLSVLVQTDGLSLFFAGDASYTEQLMLQQIVDGVAQDDEAARQTLKHIWQYVQEFPTVYLPSHDPDAAQRLAERTTVSL